jgi:hypothetical protein
MLSLTNGQTSYKNSVFVLQMFWQGFVNLPQFDALVRCLHDASTNLQGCYTMCHSSVASMLQGLCDNGGDAGMGSPLETALIDGNFVSIRMKRGLSVSDWFCLRVKSSSLLRPWAFFRSATVDLRVVAIEFPPKSKHVSIHGERRLNS